MIDGIVSVGKNYIMNNAPDIHECKPEDIKYSREKSEPGVNMYICEVCGAEFPRPR